MPASGSQEVRINSREGSAALFELTGSLAGSRHECVCKRTAGLALATGLSVNDFAANNSGYLFVADIMSTAGAIGLSGINTPQTSALTRLCVDLLAWHGFGEVVAEDPVAPARVVFH